MNLNEWYSNAVTSHPGSSIRKPSLGHLKSWRTISISEFYEIPMGKKKVVPPRNLSKSEMSRSKRCDCRVKPRWRWRAWDTNKYRKDTKKTRIHDEPALETCVPLGTARKIGRDGWWWMMMMVVWNVECPILLCANTRVTLVRTYVQVEEDTRDHCRRSTYGRPRYQEIKNAKEIMKRRFILGNDKVILKTRLT